MAVLLDLERFAMFSGEIEAGVPLEEVLAREGVSREVWDESREEWLTKLGEETAKKKKALSARYRDAFAARLAAVTAERRDAPPAPPPPPPPSSIPPPSSERAAFTKDSQAAPIPAPPPAPRIEDPSASPGFQPAADETLVFWNNPPPSSQTLPFAAGAAGPQVSQARAPVSKEPFSPSQRRSGKTLMVEPASVRAGPALPFKPATPTPSLEAHVAAAPAEDPAPASARLSLEQFASLSAELSLDPGAADAVRKRWGFSEQGHHVELQVWTRTFSQDAALYQRFGSLYDQYRSWLWAQGRR